LTKQWQRRKHLIDLNGYDDDDNVHSTTPDMITNA
jgi:hypothetical protein